MHEWALAEAVVTTALKVLKEKKVQNNCIVRVKVGKLQQIDREVFQYAVEELTKNHTTGKSKMSINIDLEEAVLRCRSCEHQWAFEEDREKLNFEEAESIHFLPEVAHVYMKCPQCNSPDFEIKKGRGVWIEAIETVDG